MRKITSQFRADRIATFCMFHPLRRLTGTIAPRIPILMYHSISELDESARAPYYRISTTARVFEEQLQFLHVNGYRSISLREAVGVMDGTASGPEKPVALTFDDGYEDFYTNAFPMLSRFGYPATVFLATSYIGDTARTFNRLECLTWSQVRELQNAGVEFGSHSVSHPELRTLRAEEIQDELRCSKHAIEDKLGCPVMSFSYPYAFPETDRPFTSMLVRMLNETGYKSGVSTIIGTAKPGDDRFFLPRLPINSCDDLRFFGAKLEGGYDWLHPVQYSLKLIKTRNSGFSGRGAQVFN